MGFLDSIKGMFGGNKNKTQDVSSGMSQLGSSVPPAGDTTPGVAPTTPVGDAGPATTPTQPAEPVDPTTPPAPSAGNDPTKPVQ